MAPPSPALLIPRNMNQYSSSLSTAVKKAWSSFTLFVGKLFCLFPSQFNLCHMDVVYVHMSPSTWIWVAKLRIPWPASHSSHFRLSHLSQPWKLRPWLCVHDRARQDQTWWAVPKVQNSTQHPPPPLRASLRLDLCLAFPNLPDSWVTNWNTHQFSEKLMQNGAAYWTDTALRDFIPNGCFFHLLNKPSPGALLGFLCRQDFHFISWEIAASATIPAMMNNTTRTTSQQALTFTAVH